MKLEITLVICKWQMMNKISWKSLLKNLKLKQNHKISLIKKKAKGDVINSAMGLLKGKELVFKAFESGIFLKLKNLEQSSDLSDTVNTDNTDNKLLTPMKKEQGSKQ